MTTKMEVFMAASTAIATVAAVAQLMIALPKANPRKRADKTIWRVMAKLERLAVWWLFGTCIYGFVRFARVSDPSTLDIVWFGCGILSGSFWYGLVLARIVLHQNSVKRRELQARIDDLESRWVKSVQMHSER